MKAFKKLLFGGSIPLKVPVKKAQITDKASQSWIAAWEEGEDPKGKGKASRGEKGKGKGAPTRFCI